MRRLAHVGAYLEGNENDAYEARLELPTRSLTNAKT